MNQLRRLTERGVLMLTLTAFALTTNCLPPLVTTISGRLGVPIAVFGWLFTLQYAMFAVSAFASGAVAKRTAIGNRAFVLVGLATLSAVLLAAPLFRTLATLTVLVALLGIAGGLVESHGSVVVSELDPSKAAQYLNLSQAFFCIGGIIAPSTVAFLFRYDLSWQRMLEVLGGVIAVVAVAFGSTRDTTGPAATAPQLEAALEPAPAAPPARRFSLIILSLLMFFYTASESTIVSWLPSLLQVTRALSRGDAAGMLGSFWLGVMATRFAMFFYPPRKSLSLIMSTALILAALGVGGLWAGARGAAVLPLVWIIGLAFGPLWPSIVAVARGEGGESNLTVGVVGVGGIGAAVGPVVSSRIIRVAMISSVQPLLVLVIALELASFLLFLTVRARRPRLERSARGPLT